VADGVGLSWDVPVDDAVEAVATAQVARRGELRRRLRPLAEVGALASPTLVTAFGRGRHSSPAQPFSLSVMTMAMIRLLDRYDMTPGWEEYPRPVSAQIGGIARSAGSCRADYSRR
jgi:hypothetical protein